MKQDNELEALGYVYYTPDVNEHRNIRKDTNAVALLFFTLLALFGISLYFLFVYQNGHALLAQ